MNITDITLNPWIYSFLLSVIKYVKPLSLTPRTRFAEPMVRIRNNFHRGVITILYY